jgi:gluconokinase
VTLRLILMGVAGCGKTSVGQALSARLGVPYRDGDDLHPAGNVEKMQAGVALNDADRWPWLDRVAQALAEEAPLIIGCSALKRSYRDRIRQGAGGAVQIVHLSGSRAQIAARMAARSGHYMPLSLLDSQFAALEVPGADEGAMTVDIGQPLEAVVEGILAGLGRRSVL